ncbi:hypothetical protein H9P43_001878 [Blastocladiella emersonii ATCC 22665]|nr:hypothetical protein H9P43_001878 [Blastocladiella emersonii ATCC 22665]
MSSVQTVTPGQRIGSTADVKAGPGTYVRAGQVYATVVGEVVTSTKKAKGDKGESKIIQVSGKRAAAAVPVIGSVVTGRVKRINSRMAVVAIQLVGSATVKEEFEGVIRVENVRATERDKVQIPTSFRPGDVVRAEVLSLGEAHSYILSTARNDLGVIFAQSAAGSTMVPISWMEMQCPTTGAIEYRKVCQIESAASE